MKPKPLCAFLSAHWSFTNWTACACVRCETTPPSRAVHRVAWSTNIPRTFDTVNVKLFLPAFSRHETICYYYHPETQTCKLLNAKGINTHVC